MSTWFTKNCYKSFLALIAMLGMVTVSVLPVAALELDAAKSQGVVGETHTGYLAAVQAATPEVKQLVDRINNERKQRYTAIANQNKTPVAAVEALAGKKAVEMTPSGQFVQTPQGQWTKK